MTHTSLFFAAAPLPLLQFMCIPSPPFALSRHHHWFLLLGCGGRIRRIRSKTIISKTKQ